MHSLKYHAFYFLWSIIENAISQYAHTIQWHFHSTRGPAHSINNVLCANIHVHNGSESFFEMANEIMSRKIAGALKCNHNKNEMPHTFRVNQRVRCGMQRQILRYTQENWTTMIRWSTNGRTQTDENVGANERSNIIRARLRADWRAVMRATFDVRRTLHMFGTETERVWSPGVACICMRLHVRYDRLKCARTNDGMRDGKERHSSE